MYILLNNTSLEVDSINYDSLADRVDIRVFTDDVTALSEIILDPENLSDIHSETDTFKGYTEIRTFTSFYDANVEKFNCYISLETGESTHEKLVKRIEALENAKSEITEMAEDIKALQKVNIDALESDNLISADKITVIRKELATMDKPVAGQITLDDSVIGKKGGASE